MFCPSTSITRSVLILAFLILAGTSASLIVAQDSAPTQTHNWEYISFGSLPRTNNTAITPSLQLNNTIDNGLVFSLQYYVRSELKAESVLPPDADILVRLHHPDGSVDEGQPSIANRVGVGNSWGMTYSFSYGFPWGENVLDEAWIELCVAKQMFWLEVPYGFTRNPSNALSPSDGKRGRPVFAPAMKDLGPADKIIPWHYVHYDLGSIQHGWRLCLDQANPFDAEAEITLYRDDTQIRKSIYLWELHSPRSDIEIRQPDGNNLHGHGMSIRLQDAMRRTDSFKFNRNASDDTRCWGTVAIKIDDESYECVVPSSLFRYVHGVSDPYHKALVPRK